MLDNHFHIPPGEAAYWLDEIPLPPQFAERQLRKARELGMGYRMGPRYFKDTLAETAIEHLTTRVETLERELSVKEQTSLDLQAARDLAASLVPIGPHSAHWANKIKAGDADHGPGVRAALAGIQFGRAQRD